MALRCSSTAGLSYSQCSTFQRRANVIQLPCRESTKKQRQCAVKRACSVRAEIKYVDVKEAKKVVDEEGYTILDVRDETQYEKARITAAKHVPFFVVNNDMDFDTIIKRQLHFNFTGFIYGLAFTKPNEKFLQQVGEAIPKDSKVLLVCQEGMRASVAARQLEENGYENLAALTGGLQRVPKGWLPSEGPRELQDAGKGGFVSIQTQVSAVLAVIIFAAYAYLEYFPEQAANILNK